METQTETQTILDLNGVVAALAEMKIAAYVEQTGGGCATIQAGDPYTDEHGDIRYPALAGPGWFDGPDWTLPRADITDFYVGADDDGEGDTVTVTTTDVRHAAAIIAQQVRTTVLARPDRDAAARVLQSIAVDVYAQLEELSDETVAGFCTDDALLALAEDFRLTLLATLDQRISDYRADADIPECGHGLCDVDRGEYVCRDCGERFPIPPTTGDDAESCTGVPYVVNPDEPNGPTDVRHNGPCPLHDEPER